MSNTPIRGVLFDKDGTLLDFDATWPPAYAAVAEELAAIAGDPGLAATIMRLGGYGDDGALDPSSVFACGATREIVEFCAHLPQFEDVEGIAERLDAILTAYGERGPLAVDNLAALLEGWAARGLRLGVATNDSMASTKAWIACHDFEKYFDFVAGIDQHYGPKPDPKMFEGFCTATRLEPSEVCMVGDTITDAEFARAGGAGLTVIVRTGAGDGDALAALADRVIPSVAELGDVLKT